jgi:hypothetical protein
MSTKNEKEEEASEKIDVAKLELEYKEKDKERSKVNKNDFNKIVYVEYEDIFKKEKPEIDFLYDYSKILGSDNSDPKIIQWQLANLDRLFKYGIDISVLKKRNNQQNLGIYKMSSIVENISYRLQKHGKLAPSIDIARVLPKRDETEFAINEEEEDEEDINIENEDINSKNDINSNLVNEPPLNNNEVKHIKIIDDTENKNENINNINNINSNESNNLPNLIEADKGKENENNENKISIDLNKKAANNPVYEDNFYDKNDPFIDDDLDNNSSEENELLYKLTLGYGNFTEQDILNNLKKANRNNSLKKKKKMKKKEKGKKSPNKKEKKKLGKKLLLTHKTKRKNDEEKEIQNKKKKKININIDSIENLTKEKIEEIFNSLISEYDSDISTDHEKESFLRRNIKIIEELYKKNKLDFISILSSKFSINEEKANVLMEYELFKSILENKYSNLSKFLNKLYTLLKENGVLEINNMEQIKKYNESVPEIGKSLNHISDNIVNYRDKFNSYMGKHFLDMYLINESLENYIPNIKERNNEYLTKIAAKFKEYEDKFKIKVEKNIFIDYIKEKYPNMDFTEDLNSDINNRKFSLDAFIVYDIGKNIISFQQIDTKENKENKEKDNEKEGNCIVDIKNTKEDYEFNLGNNNININNNNNQENIINNANFMDNINNTNNININQIGNSSKIFQSLKMNENKLKIFSSKIEVNEGKEEENNNVEQNQNKNS